LRRFQKLLDREIRRRDPNGEFHFIALPHDLDDVEPQEENFHLDPTQFRELVLGDVTSDGRFVVQLVRTHEREATRIVEIRMEFAC